MRLFDGARAVPPLLLATLVLAAPAGAAVGSSGVAALQVGLRAKGLYQGTIDGMRGPETTAAVRALQRRAGLAVDGVPGRRTRAALGAYGRRTLGRRILERGMRGWDVAQLQFLLAWHGFPSGTFDGTLGGRVEGALRRFQQWSGLAVDGRAGPATITALRLPVPSSPIGLAAPVPAPIGDRFGPRGARFHGGVDFPALSGTPVGAAAPGRVTYAGWLAGGFGKLVSVAHGDGVRTFYAHLSRIDVRVGDGVAAGTQLGRVGSTGNSTGPHLHFELRVRAALVDPEPALR